MTIIIDGVEHAYDDNGYCQRHGGFCSMAPTTPQEDA